MTEIPVQQSQSVDDSSTKLAPWNEGLGKTVTITSSASKETDRERQTERERERETETDRDRLRFEDASSFILRI